MDNWGLPGRELVLGISGEKALVLRRPSDLTNCRLAASPSKELAAPAEWPVGLCHDREGLMRRRRERLQRGTGKLSRAHENKAHDPCPINFVVSDVVSV